MVRLFLLVRQRIYDSRSRTNPASGGDIGFILSGASYKLAPTGREIGYFVNIAPVTNWHQLNAIYYCNEEDYFSCKLAPTRLILFESGTVTYSNAKAIYIY